MTRTSVAVDRAATLLLGLGLIALGLVLVAWQRGTLDTGAALDLSAATGVVGLPWWPWAGAGAGVLLIVLGLRWLVAHHRPPKARRVTLRPADPGGVMTADAASVAHAAGDAMAEQPAILKANGVAVVERRVPTVTLTATVPGRGGLQVGVQAADDVARTVAAMLGDTVAVRTVLRVDGKRRHGTVA